MLLARAHKYFLLDFHNRPMDPDIVPGKAYYDILVDIGWTLDFLMPQYYNGIILPLRDGFGPNSPGIAHYNNIKDNVFGGDATKIVFGFCISDCSLTGTNTDAASAVNILGDLEQSHSCHGGAFFWVVAHDINGAWSNTVANALLPNIGCSSNPSPPSPTAPTPTPPSPSPPVPTSPTPPTPSPPTAEPTLCCPAGFTGLKSSNNCANYHHCVDGVVTGGLLQCADGTLFQNSIQNCNWENMFTCDEQPCDNSTAELFTLCRLRNMKKLIQGAI